MIIKINSSWSTDAFCQFIIILKITVSFVTGDIIISSPRVTNWGKWHPWAYCPPNQYVHAFQLQSEKFGGKNTDDTSLNGIQLFCDILGGHNTTNRVESGRGSWGTLGEIFYCDGVMTGFELRSEKEQGNKDDTAANNLRAFCASSDKKRLAIKGDGGRFGKWSGPKKCLAGQAICGIRTQVEERQKKLASDDTSLNNVDMKCCDIKSQATNCTPSDAWVPVFECDNSGRSSSIKCNYKVKRGLERQHSSSESTNKLETVLKKVGFSIGGEYKIVKAALKLEHNSLKRTNHNWRSESSATWSQVTTYKGEFEVKPYSTTRVYQVVGYCGPFTVYSYKFKFVDVPINEIRM